MATSKRQAEAYIREVTTYEFEMRKKHNIDTADVTHLIRVKIEDSVSYNLHEDED